MPHLFINRTRRLALGQEWDEIIWHSRWELINAISYWIGGLIFIVGSLFFLPGFEDYVAVGAWLFVVGSLFFLLVSLHDFIEVIAEGGRNGPLELVAATTYTVGTVCFITGSIFFLPCVDFVTQGAWCFIFGSLLFVIGAVINGMQVFGSPTERTAQYSNMTALCYAIGSTLFLSGSVPYLFDFLVGVDGTKIYRFLAAQYIVGSVLFLLGGTINLRRTQLIIFHDAASHATSGNTGRSYSTFEQ